MTRLDNKIDETSENFTNITTDLGNRLNEAESNIQNNYDEINGNLEADPPIIGLKERMNGLGNEINNNILPRITALEDGSSGGGGVDIKYGNIIISGGGQLFRLKCALSPDNFLMVNSQTPPQLNPFAWDNKGYASGVTISFEDIDETLFVHGTRYLLGKINLYVAENERNLIVNVYMEWSPDYGTWKLYNATLLGNITLHFGNSEEVPNPITKNGNPQIDFNVISVKMQ